MTVPRRARHAAGLAAVVALLVTGCGVQGQAAGPTRGGPPERIAEVHRSATCACCSRHADYLAEDGYEIRTVVHDDMDAVKADMGVPDHLASCHTTVVDGYVVEGHVPTEAIDDLLDARPDVTGIALPGMPGNSPGMGGRGGDPLVVHTLDDGEVFGAYE